MAEFTKKADFFIGIDSDGCAFDTMEVKHKECFIPPFIKTYQLAAISKFAREACEFVNLYSKWRGANRFPAYLMALDLLAERPEVAKRGFQIPRLPQTRKWIETETKLGNPALQEKVQQTNDPELTQLLAWSKAVNKAVEETVFGVPPFPMVRESLQSMQGKADVVVVSATPGEALKREWAEHDLDRYVALICGQEAGTKKETLAPSKQYAGDHSLMIGDAPGDLSAAKANKCLFFPILPGDEDTSWQQFHDEGLKRFLDGSFAGAFQDKLIADFEKRLPETPPWKG